MAIKKEIWDKAKALFEQGLSLNEIELETEINRTSISKKAKKEGWIKAKNQQLKADIKGIDKDNSTLKAKINTTVEKLATLSDFEITMLDEQIQDETGCKSLLFSTMNLAIIRANQMLTKNQVEEKINKGDGMQAFEPRELNTSDVKNLVDSIDKASVTLGVNERFSNQAVNVNNTQQQITGVQLLDA